MTGVAGMLVAGVLHIDEAYAAINWKTVFLVACLIPLGWAMDSSGAGAWIAGHTIERLPEGLPVWVIEVAIALLTTLFSLVISHVGATIVMVRGINLALAPAATRPRSRCRRASASNNSGPRPTRDVVSPSRGPPYKQAPVAARCAAALSSGDRVCRGNLMF